MNRPAVDQVGQFLVFCLEEFKAAQEMTGAQAFDLFEQAGVFDYLQDGYDQLHTLGSAALIEDIQDYLRHRPEISERFNMTN